MGDDHARTVVDQRFEPRPELRSQVGVGRHDRHHVDRAVEGSIPRRLTQRVETALRQGRQRLGDPGPRLLDPLILLGPGHPAEQVAVEADLDIAVVDAHPVMPQAVTHRRQPARLQLVRTPQLVEGPMDQDDARHTGNLVTRGVSPGATFAAMKRWLPLIALAGAQFIMVLDQSVMNVAISQLVEDFDTTVTTIQAVITLYSLVMAMFMLTGGKIGDILGRRRTFVIGLVIYACGSALTALAPTVAVLALGWSVLEGLGAALCCRRWPH